VTPATRPPSRCAAYVLLVLAGLAGGVSQTAFTLFIFFGSLDLVDLGMDENARLWLDACLSLAFFLQHSTMIRRPYRRSLSKLLRADYHGALYTIASGVVLFTVVVLWQGSATTLAAPQGLLRWLMRAVFFLSGAGFLWALGALRAFDAFGVQPLLHHLRGTTPPQSPFLIRGPYRWVRHPLYWFTLLMFWSCPDVTVDRLLFNVLWSLWVILGTLLEERDLTADFGDAYRSYQREVPMLIPWRIPRRPGKGPTKGRLTPS